MTLFKRVFNSHTAHAKTQPLAAVPPVEDEELWESTGPEDDQVEDTSEPQDGMVEDEAPAVSASSPDPFGGMLTPEEAPAADLEDSDVQTLPEGQTQPRVVSVPKPVRKLERRPMTTYEIKSISQNDTDENSDSQLEKVNKIMRQEAEAQAAELAQAQAAAEVPQAPPVPSPLSGARAPQSPEPAPAAGRPVRSPRRVRTRMIGFDAAAEVAPDPFKAADAAPPAVERTHPVGWIVVTDGPGKGHAFALHNGVSTIGRGQDQAVALDFGDTSISREKHAAIAYDDENNAFFLGHGGKSNIVRLNNRPVLSTEDLSHGDTVRIGETTLRFVALCGADFAWGKPANAEA